MHNEMFTLITKKCKLNQTVISNIHNILKELKQKVPISDGSFYLQFFFLISHWHKSNMHYISRFVVLMFAWIAICGRHSLKMQGSNSKSLFSVCHTVMRLNGHILAAMSKSQP